MHSNESASRKSGCLGLEQVLQGIYDASIPQEEEIESRVDGVHSAEMKDSGSLHLVPLIYCTKVDGDSDFDIIKNKLRRRGAKEQMDPTRTLPKGLSES